MLLLLAPAVRLQAQEGAAVTARLEPARIPLGATADLVIEIEPSGMTDDVPEPRLPDLPALVVSQSRESRVSLLGGDLSRLVVFRYRLRPMAPGRLRIDPIRVEVGGRTLETPALALAVTGLTPDDLGTEAPGGLPAFFATARVDRERVYVGEQLTLTFAFYHDPRAALAESPDYDPPAAPGFWQVEVDSGPRVSTERLGARAYHVQRFRYALFPLRPGNLEIGPATVRIVESDPVEWWRPGRPRALKTDPLRVVAEPLPGGAPESHDGAVGRFALEGGLSDRSTAVGMPLELSLAVKGVGNPTTVGEPTLPAWPDIEVKSAGVETKTRVQDGVVRGEAAFTYLLAPAQPGPLDLGSARFAYFDPTLRTYVVDSLDLGEIEVRPSLAAAASARGEPGAGGPTLWPARPPADSRSGAVPPWYWAALLGPWLAWLAVLGWHRRPARSRPLEALERFAALRRNSATAGGYGLASAIRAMDAALAVAWPDGPPEEVARLADDARRTAQAAAYGGAPPAVADRKLEEVERHLRGAARGRRGQMPRIALAAAGLLASGLPALGLVEPAPMAAVQAAGALWADANAAYRAGQFDRAIPLYRDLVARHVDPRLEADLAAALWRGGRRGEAVLHYRRALTLEPRNAAIRADLARLQEELGLESQPAWRDPLAQVRPEELLWSLLAAGTIGFAVFALTGGRREVALPVLAAVGLLAGLAATRAWDEGRDVAIVIRPAEVAAAPGGAPIVRLSEGTEVQILERRKRSWRVRADGRPAGWVPIERIEPLSRRWPARR